MSADPTSIDRIRNASFETARRGYKKADVDRFLTSLADWLASGEGREQSTLVKEALEDVGRRTGSILVTAEESAQEIREKAQQIRDEADGYASKTREQTDHQASALKESTEAEAERIRSVAARDAEELTSKAQAKVREIVAQGEATKAQIKAEIEDLGKRRDAILGRIDELASQLTGTAKQHRPSKAKGPEKDVPNGSGEGERAPSSGGAKPAKAKAGKAS